MPFPLLALPAAITAGASILNGVGNYYSQKAANAANLQATRETNEMQRQIAQMNNDTAISMMRENNEWSRQQAIDMFNMENNYNSPLEQVKRLRAAGINPAVALGGSTTSIANSGDISTPQSSPVPAMSMPQFTPPHFQAVQPITTGFISALKDFASMSVDEAQSKRITALLEEELQGLKLDNDAQRIANNLEMTFGSQLRQAQYNLMVGQLSKEMASSHLMDVQSETELEKQLNIMYDSFLKKAQGVLSQKQIDVFNEKWEYEKADYKSRWSVNRATANNANAQAGKARAETQTINEIRQFDVDIAKFRSELYGMDKEARAGAFQYECQAIIKEMQNRGLISDEEAKQMHEAAEEARKHNTMFYYDWFFDKVERVNNGVNKWAPWALSRTSSSSVDRAYQDANGRVKHEIINSDSRTGYSWSHNHYAY